MSPDDPRHGTYAGANAHWGDGETICGPCRAAATRYHKTRKLRSLRGEEARVPIVGGQRRIRALVHLGYGFAAIARELGCSREEVRKWAKGGHYTHLTKRSHDRIVEVYERLSMTLPTATTQAEKRGVTLARNLARRNGWLPPLAWDDIDMYLDNKISDEDEDTPDIDPVVVDRAMNGYVVDATPAERYAVIERWVAAGYVLNELARIQGWNVWRDRREGAA